MSILMQLGPHQFAVDPLNYNKFESDIEARWKENYTANGNHIDQFLGASARSITISGVLFPESYGGLNEAEAVAQTIRAGNPVPLFSISGRNYGLVKALSLNLTHKKIGPRDSIIEAVYSIKVSEYSGNLNRNPLMGGVTGFVRQAIDQVRTLF